MTVMRAVAAFAFGLGVLAASGGVAQAQRAQIIVRVPSVERPAFRPDLRIPGPNARAPFRQPTVAEEAAERRALRQSLDGRTVAPVVRRPGRAPATALRANAGRPTLDAARADGFARSGPTAIGGSSIMRPALGTCR